MIKLDSSDNNRAINMRIREARAPIILKELQMPVEISFFDSFSFLKIKLEYYSSPRSLTPSAASIIFI